MCSIGEPYVAKQLTPPHGDESSTKSNRSATSSETTHTPYGDENAAALFYFDVIGRKQLTPLMGTKTDLDLDLALGLAKQLTPLMGTKTYGIALLCFVL